VEGKSAAGVGFNYRLSAHFTPEAWTVADPWRQDASAAATKLKGAAYLLKRRAVRLTGCGFAKRLPNICCLPAAVADPRKHANRSNISHERFPAIVPEFE
jgi:hypothetical protein